MKGAKKVKKGKKKLGGIILIIAVVLIVTVVFPKFRTVAYENTSNMDNYPQGTVVKSGSAEGYKSDISVDVIIKDEKILDVIITKHGDTNSFFDKSNTVVKAIVETQSIEVDTIAGATKSSEGIIGAVEDAIAE